MPASIGEKSSGIPVKVRLETGETKRGMLYYREEGPLIQIDGGKSSQQFAIAKFSFLNSSKPVRISKLKSSDNIVLNPETVVQLQYNRDTKSQVRMYPPSSGNWISHVVDSGVESIFTIQRIEGSDKRLLSIVERKSSIPLHFEVIQSYETSILSMKRDWDLYNEIIYSDTSDIDLNELFDRDPPSWASLSKLLQGVSIPDLTLKESMEDTMGQLVPDLFPNSIRRQIIAFLGWLETAELPTDDPSDFSMKYQSLGVFRALVWGHIKCMIDNVSPPEYVRIMTMAAQGKLELSQKARIEAAEQNPWYLVRLKLYEHFPDWTGKVIEYAYSLQKKNQIVTMLPVTRKEAKLSNKSWSSRLAMVNHGLVMRGHVHKEAVGLIPLIYVGAAHRWPHTHLEWSARIGYETENPLYIQIMMMPPSAFERAKRIIPSLRKVVWETSTLNHSLYDCEKKNWKLKESLILSSITRKRSLRQLKNEFGSWSGKNPIALTRNQLRFLDLVSWGLFIDHIENGGYANYYGITNRDLEDNLKHLKDLGLFLLQYFLIPTKLKSICVIISGKSDRVCSVSRAFLRYSPSTQVRITEEGKSATIVSRVPESEYYNLMTSLTSISDNSEIRLRAYPISAYAVYRNNIYTRLMKNDGIWDDNVSGLLDQVRLRPKDNAE
jgi:hypothetical protein